MGSAGSIRVGIIGTGGIARNVHIPGYQRLGDRVQLVSVFDVAGDRAQQAAQHAGIPYAFSDVDEMLNGPQIDAVSICTPPSSHAELAELAFKAGWHVLCEKPAAADLAGAQRLVRAAKASGKKLMVGFQHRFAWQTQALKQYIQSGELGEIYYTRAMSTRRRGIPGWGVFTSRELSGGGPMMDIGVHVLDQAMYLIGNPRPVSVMGQTYLKLANKPGPNSFGPYDPDKMETEDFAVGLVRFADGSSLHIEASWALNLDGPGYGVQVAGTLGGADCYPLKIYRADHGLLTDTVALEPRQPRGSGEPAQDAKIAHFIECIEQDREPLVTYDEIINVASILSAVYESAATGRSVQIEW